MKFRLTNTSGTAELRKYVADLKEAGFTIAVEDYLYHESAGGWKPWPEGEPVPEDHQSDDTAYRDYRVENGRLVWDCYKVDAYLVELESLEDLMRLGEIVEDELIVGDSTIEVYDDYRE